MDCTFEIPGYYEATASYKGINSDKGDFVQPADIEIITTYTYPGGSSGYEVQDFTSGECLNAQLLNHIKNMRENPDDIDIPSLYPSSAPYFYPSSAPLFPTCNEHNEVTDPL